MTYKLEFCQGEKSQHAVATGDGKAGKNFFIREIILKPLLGLFNIWTYDYNHNGFKELGTPVRSLGALIDASVQYLPQQKDKEEMNEFLEIALRIGNRIVALDEFHTQQNGRGIPKPTERFLKTARHRNISWIVLTQSPLELNDAVYHNQDHIFAFFMDTTNRHVEWYYDKFGKKMTLQLIKAHFNAVAKETRRPYIYKGKGAPPRLYTIGEPVPQVTPEEIKAL